MKYPELVFSAPKKSGKTAFAAMILIYVVRALGGRYAEGFSIANSHDQAAERVFLAASRIVEASPLLAADAKVLLGKIVFVSTGGTISPIPTDYSTAAGANPAISIFDELWGFTSERDHRLFDEMVPPPTRRLACRLTVTYAGFEGESQLLETLYARGMAGEEIAPDLYAAPGLLMFWTHAFTEARPEIAPDHLPVWVGVDASTKRDSTAIVAVTYDHWDTKKVRLVAHRVFQPSPDDPLDFEATVEETLLFFDRIFWLREVKYDPYQMAASAQRLEKAGLPMVEFPQTAGNLTAATSNLYELVKGRNMVLYPDAAMRLAAQRCVAVETSRGWRIAKEKASHKIDSIVGLAQAALGAIESVTKPAGVVITPELIRLSKQVPNAKFSDRYGYAQRGGVIF
jgi:phage terminase large subunit-like protein